MRNHIFVSNDSAIKRAFSRVYICMRFSWDCNRFWNHWLAETKTMAVLFYSIGVSVFAFCLQACLVILFPAIKLAIEPVITGLKTSDDAANHLNEVLNTPPTTDSK